MGTNEYLIRSRESTPDALRVLGDAQSLLLAGADTGKTFSLIDQENLPGFEVPLNVHDAHDETNYLISGEVTFEVGSSTHHLRAGDCLHIYRGTPHRFRVIGATPARMLLLFHPSGLELLFRELDRRFLGDTRPSLEELNRVCAPFQTRVLEL